MLAEHLEEGQVMQQDRGSRVWGLQRGRGVQRKPMLTPQNPRQSGDLEMP